MTIQDFRAHSWWYIFLFLVGAASTAVEITGLRFLAPLFGSSLPVWGSAIATVLAGLALGYAQGGMRARHGVSESLVLRYATWAAAFFLLLPPLFRLTAWLRTTALSDDIPLLIIPALILAFLALFVPSVAFGMVTPLAVQAEAARRRQGAGQVSGRISTLTTLGSLAGILIPSFLTIPLLGTRATVIIFALLVLGISLSHQRLTRVTIIPLVLVLLTALMGVVPSRLPSSIIFTAETAHQHVLVEEKADGRVLMFDAGLGIQSMYAPATYTNGYWDYLAALPAFLPDGKSEISVLVLGAAASTTERQLTRWWQPEITFNFTSVELDGALFDVAAAYFDPPHRHTVVSDARVFAASDTNQYDIIIVDAYSRELTVPFHLVTTEFFQELAPRLAPDGILAINANAAYADTLWLRSLTTTLATVFPEVRIASLPESCNHLLLAGQRSWVNTPVLPVPAPVTSLLPVFAEAQVPERKGWVLTDDYAPTDMLGIFALLEKRQAPACAA